MPSRSLVVKADRAEAKFRKFSASIGCYKVLISIEKIICSDQRVADLDAELRKI